jgi:hypothetical protein
LVEALHPIPEPCRAGEQDVRDQERRQWQRKGCGVDDDDEKCPEETLCTAHGSPRDL